MTPMRKIMWQHYRLKKSRGKNIASIQNVQCRVLPHLPLNSPSITQHLSLSLHHLDEDCPSSASKNSKNTLDHLGMSHVTCHDPPKRAPLHDFSDFRRMGPRTSPRLSTLAWPSAAAPPAGAAPRARRRRVGR